jgi:hypothetical protein
VFDSLSLFQKHTVPLDSLRTGLDALVVKQEDPKTSRLSPVVVWHYLLNNQTDLRSRPEGNRNLSQYLSDIETASESEVRAGIAKCLTPEQAEAVFL